MRDPNNPDLVYESRMHRRVESEANLLGVVYSDPGVMTAAPYEVKKPITGFSPAPRYRMATALVKPACMSASLAVHPAMKPTR